FGYSRRQATTAQLSAQGFSPTMQPRAAPAGSPDQCTTRALGQHLTMTASAPLSSVLTSALSNIPPVSCAGGRLICFIAVSSSGGFKAAWNLAHVPWVGGASSPIHVTLR